MLRDVRRQRRRGFEDQRIGLIQWDRAAWAKGKKLLPLRRRDGLAQVADLFKPRVGRFGNGYEADVRVGGKLEDFMRADGLAGEAESRRPSEAKSLDFSSRVNVDHEVEFLEYPGLG